MYKNTYIHKVFGNIQNIQTQVFVAMHLYQTFVHFWRNLRLYSNRCVHETRIGTMNQADSDLIERGANEHSFVTLFST